MWIVPRTSKRPRSFCGARSDETASWIIPRETVFAGPTSIERRTFARPDRAPAAGTGVFRRSDDARRSEWSAVPGRVGFLDVPGKIRARESGRLGTRRRANYQ